MSRAVLVSLVVLMLAPLGSGCQKQSHGPAHSFYDPGETLPAVTPQPAVAAANAFGFNLFHKLTQSSTEDVFISPTSLMLALAMTYNGARGETKAAMAKTLGISSITLSDLNKQLSGLQNSLQTNDGRVQMEVANSLWASQGFTFRPQFVEVCDEVYGAHVRTVDFGSRQALNTINGWASEKTHGLIPTIVTPQDLRRAALLLLDAVYFKGKWSNPFEVEDTRAAEFTLRGGKRKTVQMMARSSDYIYAEDSRLQAVALPYGDGRIDMIVVLPRDEQGLPALQKGMDAKAWTALLARMARREGTIKLPRFQMAYEAYVEDALKALGMGVAFTPNGDFSAMAEGIPGLAYVKHKSFLRVTEKKTEAAAVAAPGAPGAPAVPAQSFEMIVDHPFLLGIVDTKTGAVLFLGGISDPKETRAGE